MIYLIGGASRAGKTRIAKRLMSMTDIPIVELDYLKMGLHYGLPEYGVHPLDDEETIGKLLWPIVAGMIRPMTENGDDYIIEGTYILPDYAVQMQDMYGPLVRSCFLGYAEMEPQTKLAELKQYGGGADDSLGAYDDTETLADIEHFVWFSQFLRAECKRLGLSYIEVTDCEFAIEQALSCLLQYNIPN